MYLAVPIFVDDKIYNQVETKKPRTGVITAAYEKGVKGNIFRAMLEFTSGCIENITSTDGDVVENPVKIKRLCADMPYISAEVIAIKVMAEINEDDVVEGVYSCPRCGTKIITENDIELGVDSRDRISEIETVCMEETEYNNTIVVELSDPVKINNTKTGEALEVIERFEIRYPTIQDCISAAENMQDGQEVRVQLKIYVNALLSVNGKPIDRKWIANFGKLLFANMYPKDMSPIGNALQKYGLNKVVDRVCYKCHKEWKAPINTSNFFALGLQSA